MRSNAYEQQTEDSEISDAYEVEIRNNDIAIQVSMPSVRWTIVPIKYFANAGVQTLTQQLQTFSDAVVEIELDQLDHQEDAYTSEEDEIDKYADLINLGNIENVHIRALQYFNIAEKNSITNRRATIFKMLRHQLLGQTDKSLISVP